MGSDHKDVAGTPVGDGEPRRGESSPTGGGKALGRSSRRYSAGLKLALIRAYEASGQDMREFCTERGLSTASLCKWRRAYRQDGESALAPRNNPRNTKGQRGRLFTPQERLAAVEAWSRSELTQEVFCRRWGVSTSALRKWVAAHAAGGGQALSEGLWSRSKRDAKEVTAAKRADSNPTGRTPRLPQSTEAAIVAAKTNNPSAGLKRIRQGLWRLFGVKVSTGGVRRVLKDHGLHDPIASRRRRGRPRPRRFERARPGQLWQTDITSYVLPRPGRRVYLTVFLDDHSRYIVSWRLLAHQRQELVLEALEEGLARYGKPTEILTDQGPQYHSWRGRSAFRKRLEKEGIAQVVARAHHPQTLGKCERLWKTIGEEFWSRVRPDELGDAQRRLGHWIAHYNFFRPHQGIGGVVPADRFFGAEDTLRATLASGLSADELGLALAEPEREPVYLFGRVGGRSVSLRGERGELVLATDGEPLARVPLERMGMASPQGAQAENSESALQEQCDDGTDSDDNGGNQQQSHDGCRGRQDRWSSRPASPADGDRQDAEDAGAGAGAVGVGHRGAAATCTSDSHGDPGDVAGQDRSSDGGRAAGGDAVAGVAAQQPGDGGYAGGPADATSPEAHHGAGGTATGARSGQATQADRAPGEGAVAGRGRDRAAARAARQPRSGDGQGGPDDARSPSGQNPASPSDRSQTRSAVRGKKDSPRQRRGRRWLGRWVGCWLKKAGSDTAGDDESRGGSR